MSEIRDIVVIGAGAAGIAAARTLADAGRRVTVLEARRRPGGRAVVDASLGVPADLGAAWLHFAHENPFTRIAREAGFTVDEREPDWGPHGRVAGQCLSPAQLEAWQASLRRYYEAIGAAAAAGRDVALTDVLPADAQRARFDAVMTWAVGAESSEISTVDLDNYAEGGPNWSVAQGLGAVVTSAAGALAGRVEFRYGAEITHIDWRGIKPRIHSTAGEQQSDALIITIPTSVLAHGAVRFDPPLPDMHREAVADLPLGVVNKVFFRFEDGDLPREPLFTIGTAATSRTSHHQLRPGGQPLVMSYFGGDLSRELELGGGLGDFARTELRQIFGGDFVARIRGELSTAWLRDPHAMGSYSVARPGRTRQRAALAAPLTSRVLFAGEACSRTHFGTLLGAWESGGHAARQLLGEAAVGLG